MTHEGDVPESLREFVREPTITVGEYTLRPLGLGQPGVSVMHASGEGGTFTIEQFEEAMVHLWRHF